MLTRSFACGQRKLRIVPREQYGPWPAISDRRRWGTLPLDLRRGLVAAAVKHLGAPWPALPARLYLEFARNGNRSRFEAVYFARRQRLLDLVLAECAEDRGRFLDDILDGLWLVCEESSWCLPAHIHMQASGAGGGSGPGGLPDLSRPFVDLFAAETGALLAWTSYLLGDRLDRLSSLLRPRLAAEIDTRILTPFLARKHWWMTVSMNWNPWIHANLLNAALLTEQDSARRARLVARALRGLDRFLSRYPVDGGCDEGASYWAVAGAALFDCLEALHVATRGALGVWELPLIREIARYIQRAHLAGSWFANFADGHAIANPPAALIFRFGERIGDRGMQGFGAFCTRQPGAAVHNQMSHAGRALRTLFTAQALRATPARAPLPRDVWLPITQIMVARPRGGSDRGLTVAAKGGHNAEAHNHNDVGQFLVHADGRPVLVDPGVETYSRKTFSRERYDIWTMQSQYHNLPTVNRVMQKEGAKFRARAVTHEATDAIAALSLDLAPAYPPAARIRRWLRRLALDRRTGVLAIEDAYEIRGAPKDLFLSLMTPCAVSVGEGIVRLGRRTLPDKRATGRAVLEFDPAALRVKVETLRLADPKMRSIWGDRLHRLVIRPRGLAASGRIALALRSGA